MIDPIVQEVRDIRASIAEEFGFDRERIIAWARAETEARKAALKRSKSKKSSTAADATAKAPVAKKRPARSSRRSA